MLWFILAGIAAVAALAAIWPVLRASPPSPDADPATGEAAFYKAQLGEIQRDVERGQLPQSEAAAARAEAARRLLAAGSETSKAQPSPSRARARLAAAALIAVGLPAVALPLYAILGQPQMPDQPLASRAPASLASDDIEAAVAGVGIASDRQARRRQGLGGDRAGLYAARALRGRGARLFRGSAASRRGRGAARRLWRSAGGRGGGRRHRQGARVVHEGAGATSPASRRRASIWRSPPSRTARKTTPSRTTSR